jgi:hypothetical protein
LAIHTLEEMEYFRRLLKWKYKGKFPNGLVYAHMKPHPEKLDDAQIKYFHGIINSKLYKFHCKISNLSNSSMDHDLLYILVKESYSKVIHQLGEHNNILVSSLESASYVKAS